MGYSKTWASINRSYVLNIADTKIVIKKYGRATKACGPSFNRLRSLNFDHWVCREDMSIYLLLIAEYFRVDVESHLLMQRHTQSHAIRRCDENLP